MARRHKSKATKYLGSRRWGKGAGKKVRGKGGKGGKGRAGYHKHKWLLKLKTEGKENKKGFVSVRNKDYTEINIKDINQGIESGVFQKDSQGIYSINFSKKNVKVLGSGTLNHKIEVTAKGFSKKAKEKIEALGGRVIEEN